MKPENRSFDVAFIGAGHNGLVCATLLARAGLKVALYERRPVAGGPVVTEEVWPGYRVSVAAFWMSLLQPRVMLELGLHERGIEVIPTPPGLHPFADGTGLVFWPEEERLVAEIGRYSAADAEAYPCFMRHMEGLMPILRRILFEVPVDPTSGRMRDLARAAALALRHRDAIARAHDIAELLTLSARDFLRRWFSSRTMLTALGCYASGSGGNLSPQTPGSAYVLARPLLRAGRTPAGPGGLVRGGMGSVTAALLSAAREAGVELHTAAPVARVEVRAGRATGLVLESGERVAAGTVVANACAQTLFLRLIDGQALAPEFLDRVRRIRSESSCFKINLAADALPEWTAWRARGLAGQPGSVTIAENLDELEEAFESARRGLIAPRPYLWILAPSAFDDTVAPPGHHTLSLFGGHVPYALRGREWDEAGREELYAAVMRQIDRYAPGFSRRVTQRQVLVPPDLERIFGLPGGHVHHAEMSIDQVFFRRPVAGCADYRTPIAGLYQCGASTHPGGGVTGVPGYNAARVILGDLGRRPLPTVD
jgi:phytoene dehydrogenase-like protein